MAQSFIKESEDYMPKKIRQHPGVKSSLEVQLELMEELRKYQAQAIDLNGELETFQDNALKNTTKVDDLIILGLTKVQDTPSSVSTKSIQRTIRELVCNLTSDIFTRFEGQHLEFTTTLQSRLGSVMDTFETHIKDHRHHQAAKALQRTQTVQQVNLTNTQLTETWECAKDISHDLRTLLNNWRA
jgi:hypothetical protein